MEDRDFRDQILDSMDIERERGITIKSNTVSLVYTARDGETYHLNLIDTPGHVDFSHEVRRSLMSCEGALLLVDASQGVEAQTVANLYLALEYDLEIVPVINKIDLPSAEVERVREEIDSDLGLDPFEAVLCSAKQGIGRRRACPQTGTRCSAGPSLGVRLGEVAGGFRPTAGGLRRVAGGSSRLESPSSGLRRSSPTAARAHLEKQEPARRQRSQGRTVRLPRSRGAGLSFPLSEAPQEGPSARRAEA